MKIKNNQKKIIIIVVSAVFLLQTILNIKTINVYALDTTITLDGVNYELVGETYQVKGLVNKNSATPIIIRDSIEGIPVTSVYGTNASTGAFANSKATSITFENPENITSIGECAFFNTKATNEMYLPNITTVPDWAFLESNFSKILLDGNKITHIATGAFSESKATNSISLPNLTTVTDWSFEKSNFSEILLDGEKITSIDYAAFSKSKATNEMYLPNITFIPEYAFDNSHFSKIIVDGNKITSIGEAAFDSSKANNEMILPNITEVPFIAFQDTYFSKILLDGEKITNIDTHAFWGARATNEMYLPNITEVPLSSFEESHFSSIRFDSEKITKIDKMAFWGARATNEMYLPNITTVPQYAFAASQFSKIMLDGTKITSIANHAFADTLATNEMSLPNITTVPDWSFAHAKFSGIYLNSDKVTRVAKGAFWKAEATNEMILENITDVAASAFEYSHFPAIYLDGTKITSIGEGAFNHSNATNEMVLPNITTIERYAFNHTKFSKIQLDWDKITSISEVNHFKESDVLYEKLSDKEIKIHPTYQVTPKAISYVIQKKVDDEWIDTTQTGVLTNGLVVTYPNDEGVYRIATTIEYPLLSNLNLSTKTILSDEITNMDNPNKKTNEIQLNLQKGEFTLQTAQVNPFGTVKLTADKQTVSTSFESAFSVIDARGTQEGWNLSVSATPFIENTFDGFIGTPNQLPLGTLSLSPVKTINQIADIDNVQYPTTVGTTTNIIDNGEVTLLQANAGEGMGQYELDFGEDALSIVVDSSTAKIDDKNYPIGITPYTSTITWNLVTGP